MLRLKCLAWVVEVGELQSVRLGARCSFSNCDEGILNSVTHPLVTS